MSTGQILLGIAAFAVVTAVLYVWGLRKSMTQSADLERVLLSIYLFAVKEQKKAN